MVDLPSVSQTFDADAQPYVDAIERMVAENRNLMDSIDKVIGKIGELKAALDSLPDEKNIKVELNEDDVLEQVAYIREVLDGIPDHKNVVVTVEQAGSAGGIKDTLTPDLGDTIEYTAEDVKRLNDMLGDTDVVAKAAGDAVVNAGSKADNALRQASGSAQTYHSWWSVLSHDVQLWGGAFDKVDKTLISKVATWHIVLDSLLEATIAVTGAVIALGGAFIALYPATIDIANRLKSIYDVSKATGQAIGPLSGSFKGLQQAMAPRAIELYGDALNALSGGNMGALSKAITGVVDLLDKWGAEIDIWASKSNGMAGVIQKGTGYLSQLGQFIANIVVGIQNLMKAEPGVAHFVLVWVDGFSKAFAVLTGISPLLDKVALALHGVMLWGGLLASIFANMAVGLLKPISALGNLVTGTKAAETAFGQLAEDATPVQKLQALAADIGTAFTAMGGKVKAWAVGVGEDMAEAEGAVATAGAGISGVLDGIEGLFGAFITSTAGQIAIAVAAVYGLYEGYQKLGAGARQAAAQATAAIDSMTASGAMSNISAQIGNLNVKMAQLPGAAKDAKTSLGGLAQGAEESGDPLDALATYTAHFILSLASGNKSIDAFHAAISNLTSQQKTLFQVAGDTMQKNQVTFTQSLGLMDLAGVKAGDSFQVAMAKINGLVTGYKNLGIQGGYLGGSINAVTLQAEQQQSQVQQLTQAWTNFISLVTGGESTFVTVAQQVQGTLAAAGGAAGTLSISNGKVTDSIKGITGAAGPMKVNIDSLSTSGLALKSSFIQSEQAMSANLNSLLQLSAAGGQGAAGIKQIDQAGKDYVASLLPVASKSQDATAMLYALAQQAGYTGADSFKSLAQWVGNVKNPMQQAEDITNKLTIAAGNLAKDVQNLAQAINTDLNSGHGRGGPERQRHPEGIQCRGDRHQGRARQHLGHHPVRENPRSGYLPGPRREHPADEQRTDDVHDRHGALPGEDQGDPGSDRCRFRAERFQYRAEPFHDPGQD